MASTENLALTTVRACTGFTLALTAWWLISSTSWASSPPQSLWLAHPGDVLNAALNLPTEATTSVAATIARLIPGVLVVLTAGVPLGVLLGFASRAFRVLESPLDFWRSIPPLAVLPICFFLFPDSGQDSLGGILQGGDYARSTSVVFGCLPIVIFLIADAVRSIPEARLSFARQIGATRWFQIRHVLAPELLPVIFLSARTAVSFGVVIIVAGEMAWGAGDGIGDRINETRYSEDGLALSYVYASTAGLIGYSLNSFTRIAERRMGSWKPTRN